MPDNSVEYEAEERSGLNIRAAVRRLRSDFLAHYRLLLVLVPLCVALCLVVIAVSEPVYTAEAVLGSTTSLNDASGLGGTGSLQSMAKKLKVGSLLGNQSLSDTFTEFTALLTSNRLAAVLSQKDSILPKIFYEDWDAEKKRWYPRDSVLAMAIDVVKRIIGRPVKPNPDQDDLAKYLSDEMGISTSLETGYITVTLKYRDRAGAEYLLSQILLEADNIIREDKRRDVSARIAYLQGALQDIAIADQKAALIDTLSQQQQQMMMIASDHRYASTYIDTPYAPYRPTSPNPIVDLLVAFILSLCAWYGAIRYVPQTGRLRRVLDRLEGRGRSAVYGS
jgi:hypothetical protein